MRYIFLILLFSGNVQSEEIENYCLDSEANAHWESLYERAIDANDNNVLGLYNLRTRLCKQVEEGELTVKEATSIFEEERNRVVMEMKRETS